MGSYSVFSSVEEPVQEKNLLPGEETISFKTKDGITLIGLFATLGDTPKFKHVNQNESGNACKRKKTLSPKPKFRQ